jgi:phage terminase large subunit-like protein
LYPRHLEFFEAGARYNERLFMAANRVGKTLGVGALETALHLTGQYPAWWRGRKFSKPISAWAAGQTSKTTKDILQQALLGKPQHFGTGTIPGDCILSTTPKVGIPEAIDTVYIRHISGGTSDLTLKAYEQGVESFYGTGKDLVWLDEECEQNIYVECLTRTLSTVPGQPNGLILFTFTPLWGMTEMVRQFREAPPGSMKYTVTATWEDAPHLDEKTKAQLEAEYPSWQRDARTKGIPQLGSGAIYHPTDDEILVTPFAIPDHWPKVFGLDVGWNLTCALWAARDNESGVVYLYSEHYMGHEEPHVHSHAIKARGAWIPGVIDPAAKGRSQVDGTALISRYRQEGLKLSPAVNAVEAGIFAVEQMMYGGKLKAFKSLSHWYSELRGYHRREGKIVKERDHAMDAMRYIVMSGLGIMQRQITTPKTPEYVYDFGSHNQQRWML